MKVLIINNFDTYRERVDLVNAYFVSKKYDTKIVGSNFSHSTKEYVDDTNEESILVETLAYKKNISIKRLISHYIFSKKAIKIAEKLKPDLIYVIIPSNSLMKFAGIFKKKHPNVKLIIDIMDLWPETFPVKKIKKSFPFNAWRSLRDKYLPYADYVISECDLFLEKLEPILTNTKSTTNYLAKKNINVKIQNKLDDDELNLAYLGSINNIIDIDYIAEIIANLTEKISVRLHIIGGGEKTKILIDAIEDVGAEVIFYGKIYNVQTKQDIFDQCHFGLNIMKNTVCVGLTMKSIDYALHGLPIINNIPGDTEKIVIENNGGVNVINGVSPDEIMRYFFELNNYPNMKKNIKNNIFNRYFSVGTFNKKLDEVTEELKLEKI